MSSTDLLGEVLAIPLAAVAKGLSCCSTRVLFGSLYLGGIAMLGSGIHLFITYEHEAWPRVEETAHNDTATPAGQGKAGGVILMFFGGFITALPFIVCIGLPIMLLASWCQGGCKCNKAQAARSRESARRLSKKVSRPVMLGGANAAPMPWPSSTTSARIDDVRARLADRGVNSSTHGTVVNDAAIEEELKAQWARRPRGHVGRTVNQLMNRTERSEEAQAAQRRL